MVESVTSVFLFVSDVRQSRDWYSRLLGKAPAEELPHFALFEIGRVSLCLHRADAKSPVTAGGCVAYWWAPDFDAAFARATSLGGRVYRGPIDTPGGRRICQVIDPFGNVFGLEGARKPTFPEDMRKHER